MSKTINIHYTLFKDCVKTIEVDSTQEFNSKTVEELFSELIEKFPEENLDKISDDKEYYDESLNFGWINWIDIMIQKSDNKYPQKKWLEIERTFE